MIAFDLSGAGYTPSGFVACCPSSPCSIQTSPVFPRSIVRSGPSAVPSFSTVYFSDPAPSGTFTQAKAPKASRPTNVPLSSPDLSTIPS